MTYIPHRDVTLCDECGKEIDTWKYDMTEYVYTLFSDGARRLFCSYSCQLAYEKRQEDALTLKRQNESKVSPKKRAEKRLMLLGETERLARDGRTIAEIATQLDRSEQTIKHYLRDLGFDWDCKEGRVIL